MPASIAKLIETEAYAKIIAPPGIAPRYQRPFTVPSDMSCHDWLNFTKVYGKYLLSNMYSDKSLKVLCGIIDLVHQCLASSVTSDSLEALRLQVKSVARNFEKDVPSTEWSIMMHLLTFHMPDTMEFWGPARGYWCFPFERSNYNTTHII